MTWLEITLLACAAFCTSALTAVVGAGGGTALIALMLQGMPPAAVIPVHGCVQLAANTTRTWLLRDHLNWAIIWRFSLLLPVGVVLGLWLFQGLGPEIVRMLIGGFVLLTLITGRLKGLSQTTLPLWVFFPVGLVTGCLNMIVGVIAPIIGALMSYTPLKKEEVVGTLGWFGVIGNLTKIIGFSAIGFSFAEYGPLIAAMVPAAILGARSGRHLLARVDEALFQQAFRLMLVALALKLIVVDGLLAL
ncbi:MAG: sulfite exporter TauE/SafE family protein [Pseudomonadota bacterium]